MQEDISSRSTVSMLRSSIYYQRVYEQHASGLKWLQQTQIVSPKNRLKEEAELRMQDLCDPYRIWSWDTTTKPV